MTAMSEGRFSAEEIAEAYAVMHGRVQGYASTGNWDDFADNFTEDAVYIDPAWGRIEGRESIRDFFERSMAGLTGYGQSASGGRAAAIARCWNRNWRSRT